MNEVLRTKISGARKLFSGKVRDIYRVDEEHLLMVSTDRVSAFDHVFPNGIPGKGIVLNQISNIWFSNIEFVKNHIVEVEFKNFPKPFSDFPEQLDGRSVLVKRAVRIDFECVARGFIVGSGWKDYTNTGELCGIKLPSGLKLAQDLPAPLFTPATKADDGHDTNISMDIMRMELGTGVAEHLGGLTLQIYEYAREKLDRAGIVLADTKVEFGYIGNEIVLIDEVLTPDSSRFWDKDQYRVGVSPVSFDKQFIRDYLETTDWDKDSQPPPLPDEIVYNTRDKYLEILQRIKSIFVQE
ncbi:MAG: phosphoribosylaminoimidazolesuccinocarboxamide synthase [Spirochaetota bacterium]|nr:phosphoribosylaminoimidazolesuccinocarboxamide synthase [Spirochaetota bacterium]